MKRDEEIAALKRMVRRLHRELDKVNKRILALNSVSHCAVTLSSPKASVSNPEGQSSGIAFRDLQWGIDIKDSGKMVLIGEEGGAKYYRREDDFLEFGGAKLSQITYGFYKGHFFNVTIKTNGIDNSTELRDAIFAAYDKDGSALNESDSFCWRWWGNGEAGTENLFISLEFNEEAEEITVRISYEPVSREKKADAAKQAAHDFFQGHLDKWNGFRKLMWNLSIADAGTMVLVKEDEGTKYYRRDNEVLKIGHVKLSQVLYGFRSERFICVEIEADGYENSTALRDAVFAIYGLPSDIPGEQDGPYEDELDNSKKYLWCYWHGEDAKDYFTNVCLSLDNPEEHAILSISYDKLLEDQVEDKIDTTIDKDNICLFGEPSGKWSGFGGMKWNADIAEVGKIDQMIYKCSDGNISYYQRRYERLFIGDVRISRAGFITASS